MVEMEKLNNDKERKGGFIHDVMMLISIINIYELNSATLFHSFRINPILQFMYFHVIARILNMKQS